MPATGGSLTNGSYATTRSPNGERPLRDLRPDAPDTDERQLPAAAASGCPSDGTDHAPSRTSSRSLDDAAGGREEQRERVVSDLVEAVVRHVRDEDAVLRRGVDVDVVVADARSAKSRCTPPSAAASITRAASGA